MNVSRFGSPLDRSDPAMGGIAINYSGGDQVLALPTIARGLYISGAGALVVVMANGDAVTFSGLLAGIVYPIAVKQITASGSSAAGVILT